ncbi:GvpL/GvpF family gas vesicle protein [Actinophytocola sp. S1-96]|uniref:GvpL/GvpF family gas vesicle protein n=1 Tax=Actinophytocola gossypii TaxID=2812003 RepID=A0ABT2J7P2_9PSEU|nr:GvpL/GvpF family gas vesicle protein [Actinophytocola gossypii]
MSASERAQQAAVAHGDRLHDTFAALAVAARRHPPQDRKLSGQPGWMVLNGAYLVDDAGAAEIAAAAERLSDELPGVRVQCTGPWSPYSFAGVDQR